MKLFFRAYQLVDFINILQCHAASILESFNQFMAIDRPQSKLMSRNPAIIDKIMNIFKYFFSCVHLYIKGINCPYCQLLLFRELPLPKGSRLLPSQAERKNDRSSCLIWTPVAAPSVPAGVLVGVL